MAYNPHRRQADPLGRPWPTPRSPPAGPGGRTGRTVHAHPGGLKPGPSLPLAPGSPRGLLKPQTLAHRLDRGLPIERALATGICDKREAGRRATLISPWSAGFWPYTATGPGKD